MGSGRQRNLNQVLASSEMLRLAGGPARGWYPKQRQNRPSSAENLDKLHPQGSLRAWDTSTSTGTGSRKPLTLPPNLTPPKFFNSKSPRDALRRVTSLLIRKGTQTQKKISYWCYRTKKGRTNDLNFFKPTLDGAYFFV